MRHTLQLTFKFLYVFIFISFAFSACVKNTDPVNRGGGGNNDYTIYSNVQYGSNKNLQGNNTNLALDVYVPKASIANQKFPLILFVHGGGFTAGDKSSSASFMESFAEAGYVAVSIDYRLDSAIDAVDDPCEVDTSTTEKAVYMAVQDTKAAIRFMVANAAKYSIDTTKIFLNGNSAGAVTVLYSYFLTQNDFNTVFPGIEAQLGGINDADNNLTNSFKIIGIASNSGCLPAPGYINAQNVVPLIFFHGGLDSVIPVDHGNAYYCPNTLYVYGSLALYNRMVNLGEPAVIHIDPTGTHGPYNDDFLSTNELCFFNSVLSKKTESGSYTGQQSSCQ